MLRRRGKVRGYACADCHKQRRKCVRPKPDAPCESCTRRGRRCYQRIASDRPSLSRSSLPSAGPFSKSSLQNTKGDVFGPLCVLGGLFAYEQTVLQSAMYWIGIFKKLELDISSITGLHYMISALYIRANILQHGRHLQILKGFCLATKLPVECPLAGTSQILSVEELENVENDFFLQCGTSDSNIKNIGTLTFRYNNSYRQISSSAFFREFFMDVDSTLNHEELSVLDVLKCLVSQDANAQKFVEGWGVSLLKSTPRFGPKRFTTFYDPEIELEVRDNRNLRYLCNVSIGSIFASEGGVSYLTLLFKGLSPRSNEGHARLQEWQSMCCTTTMCTPYSVPEYVQLPQVIKTLDRNRDYGLATPFDIPRTPVEAKSKPNEHSETIGYMQPLGSEMSVVDKDIFSNSEYTSIEASLSYSSNCTDMSHYDAFTDNLDDLDLSDFNLIELLESESEQLMPQMFTTV